MRLQTGFEEKLRDPNGEDEVLNPGGNWAESSWTFVEADEEEEEEEEDFIANSKTFAKKLIWYFVVEAGELDWINSKNDPSFEVEFENTLLSENVRAEAELPGMRRRAKKVESRGLDAMMLFLRNSTVEGSFEPWPWWIM